MILELYKLYIINVIKHIHASIVILFLSKLINADNMSLILHVKKTITFNFLIYVL